MIRMVCPKATVARFFPRLAASRRYFAFKEVFLALEAAQAASVKHPLSHLFPGVILPLKRLPALSLPPGLTPALKMNLGAINQQELEGNILHLSKRIMGLSRLSKPPIHRRRTCGLPLFSPGEAVGGRTDVGPCQYGSFSDRPGLCGRS